MTRKAISRARALTLLICAALAACVTSPIEQHPWLEVKSENFTILTDLDREDALALSRDIELFRAVVTKLTNAKQLAPRVPTRIYAFADPVSFAPFSSSRWVCGYFLPLLRENVVALDASGSTGIESRSLLFHEYTHFVVHNQDQPPVPRWYDEGFAEFMGTLRIDGDEIFIGAAPAHRRSTAAYGRALSHDKIFRTRNLDTLSESDRDMFYLQSWQIVHYLLLGPGRERGQVGARLARYVLAVERGEDDERAFTSAYGMSFDELEDAVSKYHGYKSLPALAPPRSAFPSAEGASLREVSPTEMGERLGLLALSVGKLDLAEDFFLRTLAFDPMRARTHAGLADVYLRTERAGEAEIHYERALALDPDDFENHLERAESLHYLAEKSGAQGDLDAAREHYTRAIALAPGIPEGHVMLSRTYLMTDEDPAPGVEAAERARALLPGHPMVQLTLAQLYARAGKREQAIAAARRSALWSPGGAREEAERLLETLLSGEPAKTSAD